MPCLYKLISFTRPMNMKPAQRSSPSLSTSGFQLGSIFRSIALLLGHLRRSVLRTRLLNHFAKLPPELQELAEFLRRREGCTVHLLHCCWSHLSSARCSAFFNYDVEPRVSWHGDNAVLVEGQAVQFLVSSYPDICGDAVAKKCALRKWPVETVAAPRPHQVCRYGPEAGEGSHKKSGPRPSATNIAFEGSVSQAHCCGVDLFRGSVWHLHRVEPDRHVP